MFSKSIIILVKITLYFHLEIKLWIFKYKLKANIYRSADIDATIQVILR